MKTEFLFGAKILNQEAIKWACKTLSSLGYELKSDTPEYVRQTPWSYLVRFETSRGGVYLKQTPSLFSLEPKIIEILQDRFQASVPKVIASDVEKNCFLMEEAGSSLREILKKNFDEELVHQTIDRFASLQSAVADRVDLFLDMGVPDYRLDRLPDLYNKLISQNDLLIAEGLSEYEIAALEALYPKISHLCKKLQAYGIPETLVQIDFNDNNTVIDRLSHKITLIDLGEIVIAHPFFSLLNFLEQMQKHHGLTEKDDIYHRIKKSCFKNYREIFESESLLNEAMTIAGCLKVVVEIAYLDRFMNACGRENLKAFQHWKLPILLKEFLTLSRHSLEIF